MKILLLHHVEPCWEKSYKNFGTSLSEIEVECLDWIEENNPDKVILTRFEENQCSYEEYEYLVPYVDTVYDYAYGWDKEAIEGYEEDFVEGGNHSDFVYIPQWIKKLKHDKVYLAGAFKYECLEDMEIALSSQCIDFETINHLCIG